MPERMEAGAVLRRLPRASRSNGHPAVYNLLRSLLDALRAVGRGSARPGTTAPVEQRALWRESRPEGTTAQEGDKPPPVMDRTGGGPSLLDRLRGAGLSQELADRFEK